MAHKKGVGSSKNGRESESKRLGVKIFGGQGCHCRKHYRRQRGTHTILVRMFMPVKIIHYMPE